MHRTTKIALGIVVAVLVIIGVGIGVLTMTDVGRDRARRVTLGLLRDRVNGTVDVGRIEGSLLGRFSLVDVSIVDDRGDPFLKARRVTARVAKRSLLSQQILLTELELDTPVITLARRPDEEWNASRIFLTPDDSAAIDTTASFGSWVELRDVTIRNGTVIVLQPWSPDGELAGAARDSAVAVALAGKTRARVERADYGLRRRMVFRTVDARFPTIVVAHPDSTAMALPGVRASMVAEPFHPPAADIRELAADVRIGEDTVTLRRLALRLPGSRIRGGITYLIERGDLLLALQGEQIALADLQVLYPPLPDSGGGALDLDARILDSLPSEYVVTNARLGIGDARLEGRLGLVLAEDTTLFRDTDIRVASFPTSLIERLVPGVEAPAAGLLSGRAVLSGPVRAMRVDVDGSFDPARQAPFRFAARGGVGFDDVLRTDRLALRVDALPAAFVREFAPAFPLGGFFTGDATVSGSPASSLRGRFGATHLEGGARSRVTGQGSLALGGAAPRVDVALRLDPVSLELVQRHAGGTDLRGDVRGTAHLRGTPADMNVRADLLLPEGRAELLGDFDFAAASLGYAATLRLHDVDLKAMLPAAPPTALSGVSTVTGRGLAPATMNARVSAHFRDFVVDSTTFREVVAEASARNGELAVDSLRVRTDFATASAEGTIGLVAERDGRLAYRLDVQSLAGLERWLATGDTTVVYPRPLLRERVARAAARSDSAREAERLQAEDPAVALAAQQAVEERGGRPRRVDVPEIPGIRRDSLSGSFAVAGELLGNLERFRLTGTGESGPLVLRGNALGATNVQFTYTGTRIADSTLDSRIEVQASLDSIRAAGFAFDSTSVRATYRSGEGEFDLSVFPGDTARYRLQAEYALRTGEGEIRMRELELRFDSTTWRSVGPSAINWRGGGIEIDSLDLRTLAGGGRIFIDGEIPADDPGVLVVAVDSLQIAPWLRFLQSDLPADGITRFAGRIEGTVRNPRMNGDLHLARATYEGTPFPELRTRFAYDQRLLRLDGDLRREPGRVQGGAQGGVPGGVLAQVTASLPIDLSFGDSVARRLIDGPLRLDITGDSIPLAPLAQLSEALTDLEGRGFGTIGVRGSWESPRAEGDLGIDLQRIGLAATGVTYRDGAARLRMQGDSLRIDSLVLRSGGLIRGEGSIGLTSLTRPVLDLRVDARDARILDNEKGELFADSRLRITGPIDTLAITGSATITRGVVYIPDPEERNLISTGDPAIVAVVDTATARELDLDVGQPTLTSNMRAEIDLKVNRGVWARSLDANVEAYGDLEVVLVPGIRLPRLSGALFTEQGDYSFLGRRFTVSRGSVRFTGGPALDPVLQILALYEVRQAGRAPLDIRIVIGGTLTQPKLSLESDAQPKLSQSDLISFLAFGRSSSSLLTFQGSGVSGGGQSGATLAGNVRALVTRQLAGVALGALVDEVEHDLVEALRADVLNITPANLPADLSLGTLGTILRGTELEVGKYLDRRTFAVAEIRPTLALPGAYIERRLGPGNVRARLSFETRFQPRRPSLSSGVTPETIQVVGALLRWTLGW